MTDSANGFHLNFLEHFVNIPAVNIVYNSAVEAYSGVKASNKLLNSILNTTEMAGSFATRQSVPFIKKFENQIRLADDIACKGLETLNGMAPVLFQPPEEVISLLDSEIQRIPEIISEQLTVILDGIEAYIDGDSPVPNGAEMPSASHPKLPHVTRVANLKKKLEVKIRRNVEQKFENAKSYVADNCKVVLDMILSLARLLGSIKAAVVGTAETVQYVFLYPEVLVYYTMLHHAYFFGVQQQN